MASKSLKPRISAWSYSRLEVYETCPAKAYGKYILKEVEPSGPALERGNALHQGIERYLKKEARALPLDVKAATELAPYYQNVRAAGGHKVEWELALRADWSLTGWFAPDAWLRLKLDLAYVQGNVLIVDDHKSGRVYPEKHAEQCELYATAVLPLYPGVARADVRMLYIDQNQVGPTHSFDNAPKAIKRLQRRWEQRAKPMLADTAFKPRPGPHCAFCFRSQRKGGTCRAG